MRHNYDKSKFLEILTENPFIIFACKKTGISRATIYRWIKENPDFKRAIDEAMKSGDSKIGEMAEMGLVKKINEGYFPAIKYRLDHTNSKYIPKRSIYVPPESEHNYINGRCKGCGRRPASIEKEEEDNLRKINEELELLENPKDEEKFMKEIAKEVREKFN
jgi:hypothetical protein